MKLRDSRTAPPTGADRKLFFDTLGWVANSSNAGTPPREFTIRLTDTTQFLGAAFLSTDEPMAVSHWPSSMADDCRALKVSQGWLPPNAHFEPGTWYRVR
jgi:hypothetical protein